MPSPVRLRTSLGGKVQFEIVMILTFGRTAEIKTMEGRSGIGGLGSGILHVLTAALNHAGGSEESES